jgi:hypothetical protein
MATSRIEDARDEIIAEFATISVANGFRTTPVRVINAIRRVDDITDFPEIGVELGPEDVKFLDDNWTVADTTATIFVQGATQSNGPKDYTASELIDATEALRHDIKRIIYRIMKKYINASLSAWNVTPKQQIRTFPLVGLTERRNKAAVYAQFTIRVRHQGSTFIDNADAQDFGTTGGGTIDGGFF